MIEEAELASHFVILQGTTTSINKIRASQNIDPFPQAGKPSSVYLVLNFMDLLALILSLATELLLGIYSTMF